jgi:hypothetical protein
MVVLRWFLERICQLMNQRMTYGFWGRAIERSLAERVSVE